LKTHADERVVETECPIDLEFRANKKPIQFLIEMEIFYNHSF